jgi:hypothetical protein
MIVLKGSFNRVRPMAMTDAEINKLVEKLKNKYSEYSRKNPTWFNREAFEERLLMAVRNNMNMEGFILAEISNFEKVKTRYEKRKKRSSFAEQVDRIIDEQLARIKKYPAVDFHPKAGVEISHFYGALSDFTLNYFDALFIVATDKSLKERLVTFQGALGVLAVPRGSLSSPRIEDHIVKLKRADAREIEIETDKNDYLKESAFLLHEIIDFCGSLLEARNAEWENPLRTDKLFVENQRKKRIIKLFAGLTGYGAIMKVRDQAGAIIEDFRLGAFRRKD